MKFASVFAILLLAAASEAKISPARFASSMSRAVAMPAEGRCQDGSFQCENVNMCCPQDPDLGWVCCDGGHYCVEDPVLCGWTPKIAKMINMAASSVAGKATAPRKFNEAHSSRNN